jgi:hypothetical protein
MEEFNLSDRLVFSYKDCPEPTHIRIEDVKEFIKKMNDEIRADIFLSNMPRTKTRINQIINKLAGDKLI